MTNYEEEGVRAVNAPDAIVMVGLGAHFQPILRPDCLCICFAECDPLLTSAN
jgi:hypothetical protein